MSSLTESFPATFTHSTLPTDRSGCKKPATNFPSAFDACVDLLKNSHWTLALWADHRIHSHNHGTHNRLYPAMIRASGIPANDFRYHSCLVDPASAGPGSVERAFGLHLRDRSYSFRFYFAIAYNPLRRVDGPNQRRHGPIVRAPKNTASAASTSHGCGSCDSGLRTPSRSVE